jgi:MoxR-like ATPase
VSVPELGTIRAKHIPSVVLTSNNAREMSDALKRRCLHLYIDFPPSEQELRIVRLKVPGIAEDLAREVVAAVQAVRKLDLKKLPSISETLDWARALLLLNVRTLDDALVQETLSTILKYEGDIRKAQDELRDFVAKQKAKAKPADAEPDKDLLH